MTREPPPPNASHADVWLAYMELRAEVERLTRDLEIWKRNGGDILMRAEIERLKAENARLKEIEIKYDQLISGAFI